MLSRLLFFSLFVLLCIQVTTGASLKSASRSRYRSKSVNDKDLDGNSHVGYGRYKSDNMKPSRTSSRRIDRLTRSLDDNDEYLSEYDDTRYISDDIETLDGSERSLFEPIRVVCEINGFKVPAVIDTGAEVSVMSASCAKRLRLSHNIDTRFAGKAVGVGSSDILGRIDNLPLTIGPVSFKGNVCVLRDSGADFLLGLDFLRRFRADIRVGENELRVLVRGKLMKLPIISRRGAQSMVDRRGGGFATVPARKPRVPVDSLNEGDGEGDGEGADSSDGTGASRALDGDGDRGSSYSDSDLEVQEERVSMEGV